MEYIENLTFDEIAVGDSATLVRTLRPYAGDSGAAAVSLEIAPFLLALLYLFFLSRRALRISATRQSRLDPDTL